ncbi:MAG: hypothetical protein GYB21_16635 [Oceanospirillales bacterium]|nr:hypothetical protein [Oceanospirillales bacterium]
MNRLRRVCVCLLLAAGYSAALRAHAETCSGLPVSVKPASTEALAAICPAAASALDFLASYGITPKRTVSIKLVDSALEHYGYSAIGSYDRSTGMISLMSKSAMEAQTVPPMMYGQPFDAVHYRGAVAHEIAHALFHQNSPHSRLSNAAQEYLAHATQMAVLPADVRAQVILAADVGTWESGDSISEVYMAMAPEKFAVKSYLHFVSLQNPDAFIQTLLNVKWFYVYAP